MEAFWVELVSIEGQSVREEPYSVRCQLPRQRFKGVFPESSDTSATEPGGRVFTDKE